jgi:predicted RNase H-like HicB family nuclease
MSDAESELVKKWAAEHPTPESRVAPSSELLTDMTVEERLAVFGLIQNAAGVLMAEGKPVIEPKDYEEFGRLCTDPIGESRRRLAREAESDADRRCKVEELKDLLGKVDIDMDLAKSRRRPTKPDDVSRTPDSPAYTAPMSTAFKVEVEREDDGRWIAEVMELPGVLAYGKTRDEAMQHVEVLALRVLADRVEHGEAIPEVARLFVTV